MRTYIWKGWKKSKTRFKMLQRLGIYKNKAWEFANTRKCYWRIASSPILQRTLTNNRIQKLGFKSLTEIYQHAHKKFL